VARVESSTSLPAAATRDPLDPEYHRERRIWTFNADQAGAAPLTRVTLTVRVRPIGLAILGDLVDSGHLSDEVVSAMPVIDVLPNRCYDEATVETHGDIIEQSRANCEDPDAAGHTLLWLDSEANDDNRNFRVARVDGVPARCLSHPTYVSVPAAE
jgi:hypothetical protein